jgi:hypothetical protein
MLSSVSQRGHGTAAHRAGIDPLIHQAVLTDFLFGRETQTPPSAETPIAPRCTDQGPSDQGPIDPSRQSEHPCCDMMIAWLVPLASLTVMAQRSSPRFSDGVDVPS